MPNRSFSVVKSLFRKTRDRRSQAEQNRHRRRIHTPESLERRQVLAFDFVSASVLTDNTPFFVINDTDIPVLTEAPQQVTLRFTPGVEVDPASLSGISIVRSGGHDDLFGDAGTVADISVASGLLVDDMPSHNQVVIRFKETLPDDSYRISIQSTLDENGQIFGLRSVDGQAFRDGGSFSFDVRLSVGPQVVAVVPQPITRDPADLTADLEQASDTIHVYFDSAEPLKKESAETSSNYKLIEVNAITGEDETNSQKYPLTVSYDQTANLAVLTFASGEIAADKLYRLEIGGQGILPDTVAPGTGGDPGSSFATAVGAGFLDTAGVRFGEVIEPQAIDSEASIPIAGGGLPNLFYPEQPGTIDEPGHRDIPVDHSNHGDATLGLDPDGTVIHTIPFNFRSEYGLSTSGNQLYNLITDGQKVRVREVFDLFSRYAGVRFVETANDGIAVVLGDTTVISDNSPTESVDGLARGSVIAGVPTADAMAIISSFRVWGKSEYGGGFFLEAMRQIGEVLGLWHSYDTPSVLGDSLPGEGVFPSDNDLIHLQQLYPPAGTDIDLYRFSLDQPGTVTAEAIAGRLTASASTLDPVLSLYKESYASSAEVVGLTAEVVGPTADIVGSTVTVAGTAPTVTALAGRVAGVDRTVETPEATVAGKTATVSGTAIASLGVAAVVEGFKTTVQSAAAEVAGVTTAVQAVAAKVVQTATATATVFLDDVAAIRVGSLVSGGVGIPLGTQVEDINQLNKSVTLSNPITVPQNALVAFGLVDGATVRSQRFVVGSAAGIGPNVPVNGADGVAGGTTVTAVDTSFRMVTLSSPANIVAGDELSFGFSGSQVELDDAAAVSIGAVVQGDGLPADVRVAAVNLATKTITLTKSVSVADAAILEFGFVGAASIRSNRFVLADTTGVVEGVLVNGAGGIVSGTRVESVDPETNMVTLSAAATVLPGSAFGFGFKGTTITVDDASAIAAGVAVTGVTGVLGGTTVTDAPVTNEVTVNFEVDVADGDFLSFAVPQGETRTVDLITLVEDAGVVVGAAVTGVPDLLTGLPNIPSGVVVDMIDRVSNTVRLSQPIEFEVGDELTFGINGTVLYLDGLDPQEIDSLAFAPLSVAGVETTAVVTSTDGVAGLVRLSESVNVADGAAVEFGFGGTVIEVDDTTGIDPGVAVRGPAGFPSDVVVQDVKFDQATVAQDVTSDIVLYLDDVSLVQEGGVVSGAGIPPMTRVVAVDTSDPNNPFVTLSNAVTATAGSTVMLNSTVTLSKQVSVHNVATLDFGLSGTQITLTDLTNVADFVVGTPVVGEGVPAGTTVTANPGTGEVTLSDTVSLAPDATVSFGYSGTAANLVDATAIVDGMEVSGDGIPSGTATTVTKSGNALTFSAPVTILPGQILQFAFGANTDIPTAWIVVDDSSAIEVGAPVSGLGVGDIPAGTVVEEVVGNAVRLSAAITVSETETPNFGFGGALVTVADLTGVSVGAPLVGAGIPVGTTVKAITPTDTNVPPDLTQGGVLELSQPVAVAHNEVIDVGVAGDTFEVTDLSGVVVGAPVNGLPGIRPGTTVDTFTPINPLDLTSGGTLTLSQAIVGGKGETIQFGMVAGSVFGPTKIYLQDTTGILQGSFASGLPDRGATEIFEVSDVDSDADGDFIEIAGAHAIEQGWELRFSQSASTLSVIKDQVVGQITNGSAVTVNGAATGETVTAYDPATGQLTLSGNVAFKDGDMLGFGAARRELIARNDNSFGRDSFLSHDLEIGNYYVAVTSVGNTDFNPEVEHSGYGGRTQGAYELLLRSVPRETPFTTIVDASQTPLDGDRDGQVGGAYNFWFRTGSASSTVYVDKLSVDQAAFVDATVTDSATVVVYSQRAAVKAAVSGSTTVTLVSTAGIEAGWLVSGANVPDGTTVTAVNSDGVTLTLDTNVTAAQGEELLFAESLAPGMEVIGTGVPQGTSISAVASDGVTLTLSAAVNVTADTALYFATPRTVGGATAGRIDNPYRTIDEAILDASDPANNRKIIRIVGNAGDELAGTSVTGTKPSLRPNASVDEFDPHHYYVGLDDLGNPLLDGERLAIPAGVTLMVDAGAVLRMREANIEVGSSSELASRAGAALQLLGVPDQKVLVTSAETASTSDSGPLAAGGDWGGIVFRSDSDWTPAAGGSEPDLRPFLNTINQATISYGGGRVVVDAEPQNISAIQIEGVRPSIGHADIIRSAGAAISATPNSFAEGGGRSGPELRGNLLDQNSINGLFVMIRTAGGAPLDTLDVAARFTSTEVVYVFQESLLITGGAGSYFEESPGVVRARESGRLAIDPGVVIKLMGSRIELERGAAQLIAESDAASRIVFTSLGDPRFGAGGTFDTNGNLPDVYGPGDWGGIILGAGSQASIDRAFITGGGGEVGIEGMLDRFNVIEVHQGDLRLTNTRLQSNADGLAVTDRTARGTNESATIFVRGAQPIIIGNDFRDNAGAVITINANALTDQSLVDIGRQEQLIDRYGEYDDNFGPLIRDNRISYGVSDPIVTGSSDSSAPVSSSSTAVPAGAEEIVWNGDSVLARAESWVVRTGSVSQQPQLLQGWSMRSLGEGYYQVTAPGASMIDLLGWAEADASVEYVEPDFVVQTTKLATDPSFSQLWGLHNTGQTGGTPDADIDAPEMWDITTGSSDVVIAVIDTGVDYTHPDLAANIWVNPGEVPGDGIDNDGNGFIDDVNGWDFANNDNDPMDTDGHGTHVAGTIGAVANNGIGITGVAWDVKIVPVKFLDPFGATAAAIASVNYVTTLRQQGINVVASNNSWGGGGYSQALYDAIEAANQAGVLFVASAGNYGTNNDQIPHYPSNYTNDNVISVAATDHNNALAGFSQYGVSTVDIGAPGVDIYSTLPGNSYGSYSGTSMASPHVSGAVALLAAADPQASASDIRDAILAGATPTSSLAGLVNTGAGLNLPGAIAALGGVTRTAGLVVRGEEIVVDSVWDDTDIVHVLRDEIIVNNLHTATSMRLLSSADASLVVKMAGGNAGFTASGELLDIDDRVGGTVQVVGQPGFPVILTSLADDTAGASLDAYGFPVNDTNVDGATTTPAAGDWRSLQFLPLSNDRNVAFVRETEDAYTAGADENAALRTAQELGMLAPNYAEGTNTWESAQEKTGDENQRLGFEVAGSIAFNNPADVDMYSFKAESGSEVWIDIDNTTSSLDTVVELLDANGRVLARSFDSQTDTGAVTNVTVAAEPGGTAVVQGVEAAATGMAAAVTGVGAEVAGPELTVTGVAAKAQGYVAEVQAIAARTTAAANLGETEISVNDATGIAIGSVATLGGIVAANSIVVAKAGNTLTLSEPLDAGLASGRWIEFSVAGAVPITTRFVVFDIAPEVGVWVGADGSGNTVQAVHVDGGTEVAELGQAITLTPVVQTITVSTSFTGNLGGYTEDGDPANGTSTGLLAAGGNNFYRMNSADAQVSADERSLSRASAISSNPTEVSIGLDMRMEQWVNDQGGGVARGPVFVLQDDGAPPVDPSDTRDLSTTDATANQLVIHFDSFDDSDDKPDEEQPHISFHFDSFSNFILLPDGVLEPLNDEWARLEFTFVAANGGTSASVTLDGAQIGTMFVPGHHLRRNTQFQVGNSTRNDGSDPSLPNAGNSFDVDDITIAQSFVTAIEDPDVSLGLDSVNPTTATRLIFDASDTDLQGVAVDGGPTVVNNVDAGTNTMTLSTPTAVTEDQVVQFALQPGDVLTMPYVVVDATIPFVNPVQIAGGTDISDGTRVIGVLPGNTPPEGVLELSNSIDVQDADTVGIGFNDSTITVTDASSLAVGMAVTGEGVPAGTVIASGGIAGNDVSFADAFGAAVSIDVADGQLLEFGFLTAAVTTDIIYLDDPVGMVGAEVRAATNPGAVVPLATVGQVDAATGGLRLSQPITVNPNELLLFSFVGANPLNGRRVVFNTGDLTGVVTGTLVNEVGVLALDVDVPVGTRTVSVEPVANSGIVELSGDVTLRAGDSLGFGFNNATITVEDVTGLDVGEGVDGEGVAPGTEIDAVDPSVASPTPGDVTFNAIVDVADGDLLTFTGQDFSLLPLAGPSGLAVLPASLTGVIYDGNTAIQTFTSQRDGTLVLTAIGNPPSFATTGTADYTTGLVSLAFNTPPRRAVSLEVSFEYGNLDLPTLGFEAGTGKFGAYPLTRDAWRGEDYYTTNPRDAGMRVILPGTQGTSQNYFIRVRSQPAAGVDYASHVAAVVGNDDGLTAGRYELNLRLRQRDEASGSTVAYADIRYPTVGIDVLGLPNNSPLVGTAGEHPTDANNTFSGAQQLGNLLTSDRNTISVSGSIDSPGDVDWYRFSLSYEDIQSLAGHNDGIKSWSTVFDIDYAGGYGGDLTLSVFDAAGRLIFVGRDSNVADDQPGQGQGNDTDDLTRGSVTQHDPFIGPVQLPAGSEGPMTYYVAVSSNARIPTALDQTFVSGANESLVRLEPISSLQRVVEDHIDDRVNDNGYQTYRDPGGSTDPVERVPAQSIFANLDDQFGLSLNIRPFTLADMVLYVSGGSGIRAHNPFTGQSLRSLANVGQTIGDIDMRTDGSLYAYRASADATSNGYLEEISWENGSVVSSVGDAISNDPDTPTNWQITGNAIDAMTIGRTGFQGTALYGTDNNNSAIYYSIQDPALGNQSVLYWGRPDGKADDRPNEPTRRMGPITGAGISGTTTGLQFVNDRVGTLYGVSSGGQFYEVNRSDGAATLLADFSGQPLNFSGFAGLANAPVNLEGGRYQGMFFAVTTAGRMVVIDPAAPGGAALLENVFDTNFDGVADSHISNSMGSATGLAFSPLDINLWHPTDNREFDDGHGVNSPADLTRDPNSVETVGSISSFYFGLDNSNAGSFSDISSFPGTGGQFGTQFSSWQDDLTAIAAIGENYNLPGGAHGSLVASSFSLEGYASADRPTLYFNYFLETEGADSSAPTRVMRDSAHVLASRDGGVTWELLATNNSDRSSIEEYSFQNELPPYASVFGDVSDAGYMYGLTNPQWIDNQHVQELFDAGEWRQARVDLSHFAGESEILLRFDFSTAGQMAADDESTITPVTTRSVAADANATATVQLDSTDGIEPGMVMNLTNAQNAQYVGDTIPAVSAVVASHDAATSTVTLTTQVTIAAGSSVDFYRPNVRKNNIEGHAGSNGIGNSAIDLGSGTETRFTNNNFEGFYVDDVIIGFAERGEMVSYAPAGGTGFSDISTPVNAEYPVQSLTGQYQLEIRRGTEYVTDPYQTSNSISPVNIGSRFSIDAQFDTNDRFVQSPAERVLVLERNDLSLVDGEVLTTSGNVSIVTVDGTNFAVLSGGGGVATHNLLSWNVNLDGTTEAVLQFTGSADSDLSLDPLPVTFSTAEGLPDGSGVAVSRDGGTNWERVAIFTGAGAWPQWATLVRAGDAPLTPDTVIGFFQASPGGEEIAISNLRVTTGVPVATTGTIGDSNNVHELEQGQFVVTGNFISDALQYGVRIDAGRDEGPDPFGNYAGSTAEPHLGVTRNLPVVNQARLVPGAVVKNNVIVGSGTAGILFSGENGASNEPTSVVPFGRIVNNTIYGAVGSGTVGIDVTESAGPTIMNNVFAELGVGVRVDGTSSVDNQGNQRTVITTSAFHAVGTQVAGVIQSGSIVLGDSPFVNAAGRNFYPNAGTPIVDSSMSQLLERDEVKVVKDAVGIASSAVVAPSRDVFGQLRADDPQQANAPGLGSSVFVDRGAIERVDKDKPFGRIVSPLDQSTNPFDNDSSLDSVAIAGPEARGVRTFAIQLNDVGVGIDQSTVRSEGFVLSRDGNILIDGIDYQWLYNENTNQVLFRATSVFPLGRYLVTVLSTAADSSGVPGLVTDRANNTIRSNSVGGATTFYIALADSPTAPTAVTGIPGESSVELSWVAPLTSVAEPVDQYRIQWVEYDPNVEIDWDNAEKLDTPNLQTLQTITDPDPSVPADGPQNYTTYVFRVTARNSVEWGQPSQPSGPITPREVISAPNLGAPSASGNREVTLIWTAPAQVDPVENPLTGYRVWASSVDPTDPFFDESNWTEVLDADSDPIDGSATIVGLEQGVGYWFRVAAVTTVTKSSEQVTGDPATTLNAFAVEGVPVPLEAADLTATPQADGSVQLDWVVPVNGGSTILDYEVGYDTFAPAEGSPPAASYPYVDGTLTPSVNLNNDNGNRPDFAAGQQVWARVRAKNAWGWSDWSEALSVVMPSVPSGDFSGVLAEVTHQDPPDGTVQLSWTFTPDSQDGGLTIKYDIYQQEVGAGSWGAAIATDVVGSPYTVDAAGLTNGTSYEFKIVSTNVLGVGPEVVTGAVIPRVPASKPTNVTALDAQDVSTTVSWDAPYDGGTAITDYYLEYQWSLDNATWSGWSTYDDGLSIDTSAPVTGLTNGTYYQFRVAAVTQAGTLTGAWSDPSATVQPRTVPAAPTDVVAVPADPDVDPNGGFATVSWTAPDVDGGRPVTDYSIEYAVYDTAPDAVPSWIPFADAVDTNTSVDVTNLTNGLTYIFRVAAVNTEGTGAWSEASAPVTVSGEIAAPQLLRTTATSSSITLAWSEPSTGYPVGADYEVEIELLDGNGDPTGDRMTKLTNGAPWAIFRNLPSNSRFSFSVRAVIGTARGDWSPAVEEWTLP